MLTYRLYSSLCVQSANLLPSISVNRGLYRLVVISLLSFLSRVCSLLLLQSSACLPLGILRSLLWILPRPTVRPAAQNRVCTSGKVVFNFRLIVVTFLCPLSLFFSSVWGRRCSLFSRCSTRQAQWLRGLCSLSIYIPTFLVACSPFPSRLHTHSNSLLQRDMHN